MALPPPRYLPNGQDNPANPNSPNYKQPGISPIGTTPPVTTMPIPTTPPPYYNPITPTNPVGTAPGTTDPSAITRTTLPIPSSNSPVPNQEQYNAVTGNLANPVDTNPYIANLPQNYLDTVKGSSSTEDQAFQDLINKIGAPSSVDEAKKAADTEQLQQMLTDIGRQTAGSVASEKSDIADRGLGGPGQMSDIEAIGLAQARGSGEEAMNKARLTAYQSELDRQKAREEAVTGAYGERYKAGTAADTQMRDTLAKLVGQQPELMAGQIQEQTKRDVSLAQIMAQLEQERLARGAGKYMQNTPASSGGGFNLGVSPTISF